MTMPHLTGLNLAREILAIRPTLPIILCTGFSEQADEAKSHSAGVHSLLFKPLVISELANALRTALDETKAEDPH
jgi:CheY-like chemotaxis protein